MLSRLPGVVRTHLAALRALLVFTVACGIIYPLVMVGFSQVALPRQANGSTVSSQGRVVGSSLLCQEFVDSRGNPLPQWFQPRPSDAVNPAVRTDYGCDGLYSAGSNLGPNNPKLGSLITRYRTQVAQFDHVSPSSVPPDAVTASFSGLDPDISPAYAYLQVDRVARARHLPPTTVRALVTSHIQGRTLGFLGEPRVDVLQLNLALADSGSRG